MKPRLSRRNDAILKKLVVFLKNEEFFLLQLGSSKEEESLHGMESFTRARWKLWRSGNGLRLAHRRLPQDILQA